MLSDPHSFDLQDAFERGRQLYADKAYDAAAEQFRACLRHAPDQPAIWSFLGSILRQQKRIEASLHAHRRALRIRPDNEIMQVHYSNALCDAGRFDEAIALRRKILAGDRGNLDHIGRLAEALHCNREQPEAIALLTRAARTADLPVKLRVQLAISHLANGDWAQGFAQFEARTGLDGFTGDDAIHWRQWRGEDLAGKTILILPEQGLGDAFFAARFLPELKRRGARVIMVAAGPVRRMFEQLDCVDVVRRRVDHFDQFDFYSYPLSLPHRMGFDGSQFPQPPVFDIPRPSLQRGAAIAAPFARLFKIGMVWTGSTANPINPARATTPDRFLRFGDLPDVQLFSLYKGDEIGDLDRTGAEGLILNACQSDADFADTAGVMAQMDLVITTDTAVAHLAGALGKPTWLMLPRQGFWYWGYGDATPWYQTIRLYHQSRQGDWDDVFDRIDADLRDLLRGAPSDAP